MRKLLVIGAGRLQLPAYQVGHRLGLVVIGVDRDPDAPGMKLSDAAYPIDTRDVAAISSLAVREQVDAVVTLCTDQPVLAVAEVAAALGLPAVSPEAARLATHKPRMRDAFRAAGAAIPLYRRVRSIADARTALAELPLPAILKPPASSGSRGIVKIRSPEELDAAFEYTSAIAGGDELLLEEFIDGPEVSVETLSFGGRHHVLTLTDKRTTGDPHWVETGHVQPSRLPVPVQREIEELTVRGLEALGIMDAASHVEIKAGPRGARLIEIGARLGGDFITTELVPRSTGIDMVEAAILLALGERPSITPTRRQGAAIRYLSAAAGTVTRVTGIERARQAPGVVRLEVDVVVGETVRAVHSSVDRPGFVICEGKDADEAEARAAFAADLVRIDVVPE